jgi:hypothetical protein
MGAGAVMVTAGGVFMAVTGFEPSKFPRSVWANAWFDLGFGFLIAGLLIVALGLYIHFRKRGSGESEGVESKSIHQKVGGRSESRKPPLRVRIIPDSIFEGREATAIIGAIHISLENMTDRRIRVVSCEFSYDHKGNFSWEHDATDQERKEFQDELKRRQEIQMYGPSLQLPTWIEGGDHLSRWTLESVTRNPAGGIPSCTIIIVDGQGNRYEAKFHPQGPRTYPA